MVDAIPVVVGQVQEDDKGRWRDFPDFVQNAIEAEYQQWLELFSTMPCEKDVFYAWVWYNGTKWVQYKISFPQMEQENQTTHRTRAVRRLIIAHMHDGRVAAPGEGSYEEGHTRTEWGPSPQP